MTADNAFEPTRDAQSLEVRREVSDGDGWRTELTVRYKKSPLG